MRIIAHRANKNGSNPQTENKMESIYKSIESGFDVEIDIRMIQDILYLGHDLPENTISLDQIDELSEYLWIHCKNLEALQYFSEKSNNNKYNYFWHDKDAYTLTSKGFIWSYPGSKLSYNSINVMPEWTIKKEEFENIKKDDIYGICTDYPCLIKKIF
tara:strand:- start:1647 stop:2120 length:474 start_codon:yes stop_codon:yes gene_type:complete